MPKYRRGAGCVYRKRGWCYIKYYTPDGPVSEAARTKNKSEARRLLQARLGQLAEGRYVGPAAERVTFEDLIQGLLDDYSANQKKTLPDVARRARKHLAPFFAGRRAQHISAADLRAYIAHRQAQGAKNGTINRELAALQRAFTLALEAELIPRAPRFPMLEEHNARQGFFEPAECEAVLARLPDYLRPALTFAYYTGWRVRSEVLPLTWRQVDLAEGTVRLEVGATKNKEGRLIYVPPSLHDLLEAQWKEHLTHYPECPFVFHREGKRILTFYKAWRTACRQAGLSDKIPHDFRRTAVRNMVRAGIAERVAMEIAGHKTRSIFDRYHIVSAGDLREAASKMEHAISPQMVTILVTTPSLGGREDSAPTLQVPAVH